LIDASSPLRAAPSIAGTVEDDVGQAQGIPAE